jgi:hypothetical protein
LILVLPLSAACSDQLSTIKNYHIHYYGKTIVLYSLYPGTTQDYFLKSGSIYLPTAALYLSILGEASHNLVTKETNGVTKVTQSDIRIEIA